MNMKLHKINENKFRYSITKTHKISYILFAIFILIGFISIPAESAYTITSFFPLSLLVVSLIGIGYREEWVFDKENQKISSLIGVFVFVKRNVFSLEDIRCIEISHFTKGYQSKQKKLGDRGKNKSMTVFSLRMKDDRQKHIEIIPERVSRGRVHNSAMTIAGFMNLPFEADRDYDQINKVELADI